MEKFFIFHSSFFIHIIHNIMVERFLSQTSFSSQEDFIKKLENKRPGELQLRL